VDSDTAGPLTRRLGAAGFDQVRALPLPGRRTGGAHTFVARRAHDHGEKA
jgi:hypothetical protein